MLRARENTNVFITLDENIYDIHSTKVIILYKQHYAKYGDTLMSFLINYKG